MSGTIVPNTVDASNVTVMLNPLDPCELIVSPDVLTDLPRCFPLLTAEWQHSRLHRFEPNLGRYGSWVLRKDLPRHHMPRLWGTEVRFGCDCSGCEAWRATRVSLIARAVTA